MPFHTGCLGSYLAAYGFEVCAPGHTNFLCRYSARGASCAHAQPNWLHGHVRPEHEKQHERKDDSRMTKSDPDQQAFEDLLTSLNHIVCFSLSASLINTTLRAPPRLPRPVPTEPWAPSEDGCQRRRRQGSSQVVCSPAFVAGAPKAEDFTGVQRWRHVQDRRARCALFMLAASVQLLHGSVFIYK